MDLSIFIAKIYAIAFIAVGLGMIFSGDYYKKAMQDMLKSPGTIYLGGITALVVGFLIVTNHNIWEQSWVVLITIFGWAALIKGISLLVFPKAMLEISSKMMSRNMTVWGTMILVLGGILGYFSILA